MLMITNQYASLNSLYMNEDHVKFLNSFRVKYSASARFKNIWIFLYWIY